ncbi:hypothetical protein ACEPPN_010444 [Leptodophora sp. 'Broadleaf-Isolate-01']
MYEPEVVTVFDTSSEAFISAGGNLDSVFAVDEGTFIAVDRAAGEWLFAVTFDFPLSARVTGPRTALMDLRYRWSWKMPLWAL